MRAFPLALAVAATAGVASATPLTRADYEACQTRDERDLKKIIQQISADAFRTGVKTVDFNALVRDQWIKADLDRTIDKTVDRSIDQVRLETSWSERLKSLANTEVAQKLATNVAERVYRHDAVKQGIETLASGVAGDAGKTIEFTSGDAAGPMLECLQAFIGPQYGAAVARSVAGDARREIEIGAEQGAGNISAGSVLRQTSGGLAGATILIVRRQLGNLATRVGQRIAGSVLSRLVSVAAGGVGLILIGKDIWELRNGVLPIIATEMKAAGTKDKVQAEISTALSEQFSTHVDDIASATADHLLDMWGDFKRAHALVLNLSSTNSEFRTFLDGVRPETLPRLDEVVALITASEGADGVVRRLNDGSLNEAVHSLSAEGMEIARDTKSVPQALDWARLARDDLAKVVAFGLHRKAVPGGFTRASFETLVSIGDRTAILRLAALQPAMRDVLFGLPPTEIGALARSLTEDELTGLAAYLKDLTPQPRDRILREVAANPQRMKLLASERVRAGIIASVDQAAAADMMLRDQPAFSAREFIIDAEAVWQNRVSKTLLLAKYPMTLGLLILLAGVILLWFGRLFRPRSTS